MHPLTVLNHLHTECISQVEAANILKRDQSLSYLSQFQASSKHSTAERNVASPTGQGILQASVYEESVFTQTQGTIMLPKVGDIGLYIYISDIKEKKVKIYQM